MADQENVTVAEVVAEAGLLAHRQRHHGWTKVAGVPRGGLMPAALVAANLNRPLIDLADRDDGTLIVDDLVDSGGTAARLGVGLAQFDALWRKPHSPSDLAPHATTRDGWLVFPWESTDESVGPTDAVVRLLEAIGEDPNRPGLIDTPNRVVKALREMTAGYGLDPADVLARRFADACDEMVVVSGIEFTSLCEHHLLAFTGTAAVAYVPNGEVVGLSKLARLVDCFAQRLQVQERLTEQIADAIEAHLSPLGVGVLIESHHSCMGSRGVRKPEARMTTSALRGVLLTKPEARAEFLSLARPNTH